MREIKFRYIYLRKKTGEYKIKYQTIEEIELEDSWQGTSKWEFISRDEGTGFKDSEGSEIFEGDLVSYNDSGCHEIFWDDEMSGFSIKFQTTEHIHSFDWIDIEGIKIIGNIHQNPELLETK